MPFNRFGANASGAISLYPGTAMADYGGQTTVEETIDRAVDRVLAALPQSLHDQIVSPSLVLVVARATAGQTTATLPLLPGVSGTFHVWRGQPSQFQEKPQIYPGTFDGDGLLELDTTLYSVNPTSGVVTFTTGAQVNDQVFASYDVDATSASFSMPSLGRLAIRGAAAELGSRLFSEANQEWLLVEKYEKSFQDDLDALAAGTWIPEELRYLKWWKELEKSSPGGASSIRLYRG